MDTQLNLRQDVENLSTIKVPDYPRRCRGTLRQRPEVCEPPKLPVSITRVIKQVKSQQRTINDRILESNARVEFLKSQKLKLSESIEKTKRQMEYKPVEELIGEAGEGDAEILEIYRDTLQKQLERLEENHKNVSLELEKAYEDIWRTRLADFTFHADIQAKVKPYMEKFDERENFMVEKRASREHKLLKNATREKALALAYVKQKKRDDAARETERKERIATIIANAKKSRERLEPYITRTLFQRRQQQLKERLEWQAKQDRQKRLLGDLKAVFDKQREELQTNSEKKQLHREALQREREMIHQEFLKAGKNPYYVEYLLAFEEKRANQQRRIIERESQKLAYLQREFEAKEKYMKNEIIKRKHWNQFWSQKLKKKRQMEKEQKIGCLMMEDFMRLQTLADKRLMEVELERKMKEAEAAKLRQKEEQEEAENTDTGSTTSKTHSHKGHRSKHKHDKRHGGRHKKGHSLDDHHDSKTRHSLSPHSIGSTTGHHHPRSNSIESRDSVFIHNIPSTHSRLSKESSYNSQHKFEVPHSGGHGPETHGKLDVAKEGRRPKRHSMRSTKKFHSNINMTRNEGEPNHEEKRWSTESVQNPFKASVDGKMGPNSASSDEGTHNLLGAPPTQDGQKMRNRSAESMIKKGEMTIGKEEADGHVPVHPSASERLQVPTNPTPRMNRAGSTDTLRKGSNSEKKDHTKKQNSKFKSKIQKMIMQKKTNKNEG